MHAINAEKMSKDDHDIIDIVSWGCNCNWSFEGQLCQEYSYWRLLESINSFCGKLDSRAVKLRVSLTH